MKNPWQIGLLVLAIVGVSTYDYLYLAKFRGKKNNCTQLNQGLGASKSGEIVEASLPSNLADTTCKPEDSGCESRPPICLNELENLARRQFVSTGPAHLDRHDPWPARDPFRHTLEIPRSYQQEKLRETVPAPEVSISHSPPEPECVLSGTMIDQGHRLAIVNGQLLSVDSSVGVWRLARIEPDYIILEAGKHTRRIELVGNQVRLSHSEDSSHRP